MNMLRWGVSAVAALLFTGGAVLANETGELTEMKSSMEQMRAELASVKAQMNAQKEEAKAYVGGAPESIRSRAGNACLKIGGRIRTRYRATWAADDVDAPQYRRYNDRFGLRSASLNFQADFTPDTTAFIQLRLEEATASGEGAHGSNGFIDEAWWQWRNICGTGVNLRLGKIQLPFGEQYAGVLPDHGYNDNTGYYGRGTTSPASLAWVPGATYGVGPEASYSMGDFTLTAAVFDGAVNSYGDDGSFTPENNDAFSAWLNTAVKLEYDPSMIEGLHVSMSYMGVHAYAQSALQAADTKHTNYSPYANIAADYDWNQFNFFVENTMGWNAGLLNGNPRTIGTTADSGVTMYGGAFVNTLALGTTYSYSEKLAFTAMGEWAYINADQRNIGRENDFAAHIGAEYDFGNGISVSATYSHYWILWNQETVRHVDEIYLQSVVSF